MMKKNTIKFWSRFSTKLQLAVVIVAVIGCSTLTCFNIKLTWGSVDLLLYIEVQKVELWYNLYIIKFW